MALVQDQCLKGTFYQWAYVVRQNVVVDDRDVRLATDVLTGCTPPLQYLYATARQPTPRLSRPVELEAGGTDHQRRISPGSVHGSQRLHGLSQTHLVGEERPTRLERVSYCGPL